MVTNQIHICTSSEAVPRVHAPTYPSSCKIKPRKRCLKSLFPDPLTKFLNSGFATVRCRMHVLLHKNNTLMFPTKSCLVKKKEKNFRFLKEHFETFIYRPIKFWCKSGTNRDEFEKRGKCEKELERFVTIYGVTNNGLDASIFVPGKWNRNRYSLHRTTSTRFFLLMY